MGYEVLESEEQKIGEGIVDDLIDYTSKLMGKKSGPFSFIVEGFTKLAGSLSKPEIEKIASKQITLCLEKAKELSESEYGLENIIEEFGKSIDDNIFYEEDKKRLLPILKMELDRFIKLLNVEGKNYYEVLRNAYDTKEDALKDIQSIEDEESQFFSNVNFKTNIMDKDVLRKVSLRAVKLRSNKYKSMIDLAFLLPKTS